MNSTIKAAMTAIACGLSVCANAQVAIDKNNFPDEYFREYVKTFDTNNDGKLSQSEISAVAKIEHKPTDMNDRIKDATGLQHFTSVTQIFLDYEDLTTIDVRALVKLTYISMRYCNITEIDLSKNTELTTIAINAYKLKSLDLSNNAKMKTINIESSILTDYKRVGEGSTAYVPSKYRSEVLPLKLNYNAPLSSVTILYVNIEGSGIDFAKLGNLTLVKLQKNNLERIDLSKCTKLESFSSEQNALTTFDCSKNAELYSLNIEGSQITTVDLSHNTKLQYLYIYNGKLTQLDVSKLSQLKNLQCNENQLTAIDVSQNLMLRSLNCNYNKLTQLDVSKLTQLENLRCKSNQLKTIDVSKQTRLNTLEVSHNQITAMDLSHNTNLTNFNGTTEITVATPSSQGITFDNVDMARVKNVSGGIVKGKTFIPNGEETYRGTWMMAYEYDTKSPNQSDPLVVELTFNNVDQITSVNNIISNKEAAQTTKTIENGQMVIIRNGQKYDMGGRRK